jgi:transcription elongation factor GreA
MTMGHHRPATATLTAGGRAQLRAELDHLRREREPALVALLRERREQTDQWEGSDFYLGVQEELARVQHRIQELEAALAPEPGEEEPAPPGVVTIGSRVTVRNGASREYTYVIVSPLEADPSRGHISSASPVGAGLLGHRSQDTILVQTPAGLRIFCILRVD